MREPLTRLYVHLVWATWDRAPLLIPDIERAVYACLQAKCMEMKCEVVAIGGDLDHVHLLVAMPPMLAVSDLVTNIKGASSHLMTHRVSPSTDFKWQGAYAAFSVGSDAVNNVVKYIQNQKEHHAQRRLNNGWELPAE